MSLGSYLERNRLEQHKIVAHIYVKIPFPLSKTYFYLQLIKVNWKM